MKTKTSIIIFVSIAALLLIFVSAEFLFNGKQEDNKFSQEVVINNQSDENNKQSSESEESNDPSNKSFVPLLASETLIKTLTFDFDNDTKDDQVIAVYKAGSEFLHLIVGLYNPASNAYDRVAEIKTEITKTRTFSFSGIDMVGDHRTALVYQGIKNNGDSVMKIYYCNRKQRGVELLLTGDFTSDGTIFIQQTERSEAYELSQANGVSYTVWVHSSDKSENANQNSSVVSQIQTEYKWDKEQQKYIQSRQLKITGSRMAAKELARIQNSVETFADYLDGLWYCATNVGTEPRFIYFNYPKREVIFLSNDTEGVYSWEASTLRRSGIYLTTLNTIISSMKRRFDILLTGVNEIYVNVHDDVGMIIKESNQWNGTYKKMSFQTSFDNEKKVSPEVEYGTALTSSEWVDDSGNTFSFTKNEYKYNMELVSDSGLYTLIYVGNYPVIQLKSATNSILLNSAYALQFEKQEVQIPSKKRNVKPKTEIVINKDIIHLSPVTISPVTCYATEGKHITLTKKKNVDNKSTN